MWEKSTFAKAIVDTEGIIRFEIINDADKKYAAALYNTVKNVQCAVFELNTLCKEDLKKEWTTGPLEIFVHK